MKELAESAIDWLTATPLSIFMLETRWAWPIAESLHFMALVVLAGTVGAFDLRVLGVGKGIAPGALHRLIAFGLGGFVVSMATGFAFISGQPDQYFYNSAFHFKVAFLTLMGLNAAFFYWGGPYRAVATLGPDDDAPPWAKASAAASLAIMVAVMCCGRLLTFFRPP